MSHLQPSVAVARQLASASPQAMLPCPVCAASLRAENLERHLAKVHPELQTQPTTGAAGTSWAGIDRRTHRTLTILLLVLLFSFGAAVALGVELNDVSAGVAAGVVLPLLAGIALGAFGKFKARLELAGEILQLSYAFGLRRRSVRLPAAIEVGRVTEFRSTALGTSARMRGQGEQRDAGNYMRLHNDAGSLIVGCRSGTAFRKHWAQQGWQSGPKRAKWDVSIDRESLVVLEYQLAARGLLVLRIG
jgi:hypothetical protein